MKFDAELKRMTVDELLTLIRAGTDEMLSRVPDAPRFATPDDSLVFTVIEEDGTPYLSGTLRDSTQAMIMVRALVPGETIQIVRVERKPLVPPMSGEEIVQAVKKVDKLLAAE